MTTNWVQACHITELKLGAMLGFSHAGRDYVVICTHEGDLFCTDGRCTHENVALKDGVVADDYIECPLHGARFDIRTGKARRLPACEDL